jgi:hypothetical protein
MIPDEQAPTTKNGLRLRNARKAQALSLAALSGRTGGRLGKSRTPNREQGLRRLRIEEAGILADALGTVSATYLLCQDAEVSLTEEQWQLLRCFRRTDARGRTAIIALAMAEEQTRKTLATS